LQDQCVDGAVRVKQLESSLANLGKKKPRVLLYAGPYLYGFPCNSLLKAGDSLVNSDGSHSRTKSHATSVPRLHYGYIIYMAESHIIKFRDLLRDKFSRDKANRDHFSCTVEEAENFITTYCTIME
jgi:hypothetical protein